MGEVYGFYCLEQIFIKVKSFKCVTHSITFSLLNSNSIITEKRVTCYNVILDFIIILFINDIRYNDYSGGMDSMDIIKITHRDYCYGVDDSIVIATYDAMYKSLPRPLYILGMIVHNNHVPD